VYNVRTRNTFPRIDYISDSAVKYSPQIRQPLYRPLSLFCEMSRFLLLTVCFGLLGNLADQSANAQNYPPQIAESRVEVYKSVDDVNLSLWILRPTPDFEGPRPAVVFYFGGGWVQGTPAHFERQARALQELGLVTILVDYRVKNRHGTMIEDAVQDAGDALRWVRKNASDLDIDSRRIAAAGGSAGGHLAAAIATLPLQSEASVSVQPNALFLFNPVLVLALEPGLLDNNERLSERSNGALRDVSPYHHVDNGMPPTWIFHGANDNVVSVKTAEAFCALLKGNGDQCNLVQYEGAEHGFFNQEPHFSSTLNEMIEGLKSLDWI